MQLSLKLGALTLALLPLAAQPGTAEAGETRGFVMSNFDMAMSPVTKESCPEGYSLGSMEVFLNNLAKRERDFWGRPERVEPLHFLTGKGAKEEDLCVKPGLGGDPGLRTVQGRGVALGLNLDGTDGRRDRPAAAGTCAQDSFTDAEGNPGIDNQLYRVLGCAAGYQKGQQAQSSFIQDTVVGEHTYLIEITGIDDPRNDPEVEVGIYVSPNVPPLAGVSANDALDNGVRLMHNASLDVDSDTKFQSHARGRITDGVLTTEPVDIKLPLNKAKDKGSRAYKDDFTDANDPTLPDYRYVIGKEESDARLRAVAAADQARAAKTMAIFLSGNTAKGKALINKVDQPYYDIRHARLRLELKADGTLAGVMAGYYDIEQFYLKHGTTLQASSHGFTCPGLHYSLYRFADGDFDAKAGHCTSISTAFKVEAVPAFLVRPDEAKNAQQVANAAAALQPELPKAPEGSSIVSGWLRKLGW